MHTAVQEDSSHPSNYKYKHIHCDCQCLEPIFLSVHVAVVHIYLQLGVSYFVWVLYKSYFQKNSWASSFGPMWFTRPVSCTNYPSYWMMTLVAFLKRSIYSWFASNLCCLYQNTDTQASHILWVSSLFPSNLNMIPFIRFSIPIMSLLRSISSYFYPFPACQ